MSERCEQAKLARHAALVEALAFYGEPRNWRSPSEGFELQYDPEPSPIQRDGGQRARLVLNPNKTTRTVFA